MTDSVYEVDKRLLNRADFLPSDYVVGHDTPWVLPSHAKKIDRYRNEILSLMRTGTANELFELFERESSFVKSVYPENTEIAFYSDFSQYVRFCHREDLQMLPVTDDALIPYIDSLIEAKRTKSTINRHLASIVWWCDHLDLDDPRRTRQMKLKIKKISTLSRTTGARGQTEAIRFEHLAKTLEVFSPDVPRDCQDVCLLFVAFETLCRRSELVKLQWRHFSSQDDGTGLMSIDSSKTDQTGEGEWQYLSPMATELLLRWKNMLADQSPTAMIFRGVHSNGMLGDYLSVDAVNRAFKRIAKRIGLDEKLFSGHSTRVGAAQEMLERNINTSKIMLSGRWKSERMVTHYAKKIRASSSGMAELTNMIAAERAKKTATTEFTSLASDRRTAIEHQ